MIERNATATYTSKDQNWQEHQTIYWFDVEDDEGELEIFGICEDDMGARPLDEDGCPIDYNELLASRVMDNCIVTDEMRSE